MKEERESPDDEGHKPKEDEEQSVLMFLKLPLLGSG
jgi:hypothetical protein